MTARTTTPTSVTIPPAPRVRDADATRARVLDAAEQLFARKGFDGTRLREVAEQAAVTVPLVCHHFRDKDTLYAAVVERGLARFVALGWEVLQRGRTVAEQLADFVQTLIHLGAREPDITAILHREMADGGVRAQPLAERMLLPLKQAAVDTLRAAQGRGEIRAGLDVEMVVLHIAGAAMYPALASPLVRIVWGEDPLSPDFAERRSRALVDLLTPMLLPA
jgi:TetR/AcrR family transcriptional regulator